MLERADTSEVIDLNMLALPLYSVSPSRLRQAYVAAEGTGRIEVSVSQGVSGEPQRSEGGLENCRDSPSLHRSQHL
jgi:hypothetical protein